MDNDTANGETNMITTFSIETARQIADNLNEIDERIDSADRTFYDVVRASDVADTIPYSIPWGEFGELRCVRVSDADGEMVGHI